jgi:hypothetical protein
MKVTSGETDDGFDMARWLEGSSDVSSDAVAGFVHEACENPSRRLPP